MAAWWLASANSGASVSRSNVTLGEVVRGTWLRDIATDGRVVAASSPTLYATLPGTVQLQVAAGDGVKAGQVLLQLESPDLPIRLQQERAQREALQAEVSRAEASLREQQAQSEASYQTARIAVQSARSDLRRQQQALEVGATAAVQVEQARDALARSEVALQQAEAQRGLRAQAQRAELQAKTQAVARQALVVQDLERQLSQLAVRAPMNGQIGQLFVTDRMAVGKDAKLLTVIDLRQLDVQVQVPEHLARDVSVGMRGEVQHQGREWVAKVVAVSPEVVQGEVAVRLRFDGESPAELRQNQRLPTKLVLEQRANVLYMPRGDAVAANARGDTTVYVLDANGVAQRRTVRLGVQSLTQVEVLSGLQPGERVVTVGAAAFQGAERVRLVN